ncbi:hypothetical protein EVG20_g2390 [Dentipellis fragilis]|uniref:Uncharacterized protein n=1 Tax=Dentipellis fragilis TaxID=205917 RepID=A0A4Y9Z874_9AGAM|nr:hypothetical protein EVG20_g2390 [Dentipellis fragilis]
MCGEKYFAIQISDLWVVSVLYGLYVALSCGSIYVLLYRRRNSYHLGASVAFFLLTTAFMGILLAQTLGKPIITSIVDENTTVPCVSGTPERLHEVREFYPVRVAMIVITTSINLIADGVLIYRCVVLWPRRPGQWIGLLLGILLLAVAATGAVQAYFMTELYFLEQQQTASNEGTLPPRWIETTNSTSNFYIANNFLSLATNVSATFLIASRIWFMKRQLEKTLGSRLGVWYRAAMSMIIESGLLITASQLVVACTFLVHGALVYSALISDIATMLMVIAPTLIIVRVGMGQGFDSVVDTAHQHHASHGIRETQVRSIRFAEHRTTATSQVASLGTVAPSPWLGTERDARGADDVSEHSSALRQAEGAKAEKTEFGWNGV